MNKLVASFLFLLVFSCLTFAFENGVVSCPEEEQVNSVIKDCKNQKEKIKKLEDFALKSYNNNQYNLALYVYNKLLSFKKNSKRKEFSYYMVLGDLYCLNNNYFFGIEMYKEALSIYKKNEEINIKIANLYLRNNVYELAQEFFNEVLKNNKNSIHAKKGLGNLFYLQNSYQKAIFYYEQLGFLNADKDTILKMVDSYTNLNDISKAIEILEKYAENSESFEILLLLGQLYIENNEYVKAKKLFLNLHKNYSDNFKVCLYLANVYDLLGETSLSKLMLELSYKINSSYCTTDILQAKVAYKLGLISEAKKYAHNALTKAKTVFLRNQAHKCLNFLQNK
ncbi:MAG: tetratricopeptide repeat protein [Endomicrobium sp.]|nr:tetratricopeptide repeat protein [Endomicrobium sp.]